jgi:serine protease Do
VGIGFAIPAETANAITKQLIANGKVVRGYIGAQVQNFTAEAAEAMGLGGQKGAIIAQLTPGGPAAKGGLLPGDVVTAVNGRSVDSSTALTREVARGVAGEVLKLDIIRDGKRRTIDIRSGVRPSNQELSAATGGDDAETPPNKKAPEKAAPERVTVLGLGLVPLDAASRARYSLPADVRGVVVDAVRADSDAAERGLAKGIVITSVNMKAVTSPADIVAAVEAAKKAGRPTVLLGFADSRGRTGYVPVKIG